MCSCEAFRIIQISIVFKKMSSEAVTKGMDRNGFRDTGFILGSLEYLLNISCNNRLTWNQAWEKEIFGFI